MSNGQRNDVRIEVRMTSEECRKLEECAAAARVDKSKLIRRLLALAHRDLLLLHSRQLPDPDTCKTTDNPHPAQVEVMS